MAPVDAELPTGYVGRPPAMEDAERIFAFVAGHNEDLIGFADCTVADIRDEFEEPDYDAAADGWVVHDPAGTLVGYGWACRNSDSERLDIEAIAADDGVADWLLTRAIARARALAAALGHSQATLSIGVYRDDEAQRKRVTAHGFAPSTTYHRMRIDHVSAVPEPDLPDGVALRVGPGDTALRRDAHTVLNASFADHAGFVPRPFDEWHELIASSETHDWSQLRLVDLGGEPVAMLLGNDQFVEDENCGYVQYVGVRREARGRGLARFLLRHAFADDARRGRVGSLLHVDTDNVTPALGLYVSVGMRPVLVIDVWSRAVATAG